jgi:hypothetical protein
VNAYEYCRFLVESWPGRWTGSPGEAAAADWLEEQFARIGCDTSRMWLPCPGWEYEGEEFYLRGERLDAGAQFYSVGCDVSGPLEPIEPDGHGMFCGDVGGRIAIVRETDTREVNERNQLLLALESAGALAAIMESEYPDTYSTKMFRTPEASLPCAGVSGQVGSKLFGAVGQEARLVIRARQTQSTTSNVFGDLGPADGPLLMVCAHHEASPGSPGAYDNASGVGVILEMAERLASAGCGARLRFVGWGGHEFGILGSQWYAENHPDDISAVKRFLVFDAVGARESDPEIRVWGGDRLMDSMHAWGETQEDVRVLPGSGGAGDATHFIRAGVESVWVTAARWRSGDLYGREDRGWKPAAPFHSPIDDMRWIESDPMARAVEVGVSLVREWCAEFGAACDEA